MNRRRPIVRTIVAASVLTVTGCHINPAEPFSFDATEGGADASSEEVAEEVTEEVITSFNPPLDNDASGPPEPEE